MKALLERLLGEPSGHAQVFATSSPGDLEYLWTAIRSEWKLPETVIVVWDKRLHDTSGAIVSAHEWITPLDWALAATLALPRRPESTFRCLVVDLLDGASLGSGTAARRRFRQVAAFVPWVCWYRPVVDEKMGASPGARDYSWLRKDLARLPQLPLLRGGLTGEFTRGIRGIWGGLLAAPQHRHDISNLVAPTLLLHHLLDEKAIASWEKNLPLDRRGLSTLARFLELGGPPPHTTHVPIVRRPRPSLIQRSTVPAWKHVRCWFVDDLHTLGLGTALEYVLLGESRGPPAEGEERTKKQGDLEVSLSCFASPNVLLELMGPHLDMIASAVDAGQDPGTVWRWPRRLARLDDSAREPPDVLVLDLRLFSGANKVKKEADWLEELKRWARLTKLDTVDAAVAQACGAIKDSRPPEDAANEEPEDAASEEIEALALFPLLLHWIDPSLPIVIFSSTQQGAVLRLLSTHPAIQATASKPALSGYGASSDAGSCISRLDAALERAFIMSRARVAWNSVVALGELVSVQPTGELSVNISGIRDKEDRPLAIKVDVRLVEILTREYQRLLQRGWYADALEVPNGVLDRVEAQPRRPEQPQVGDEALLRASARYQAFAILMFLRHKRAHFDFVPGEHDEVLEGPALWAWMWLEKIISLSSKKLAPLEAGDASKIGAVLPPRWPNTSLSGGTDAICKLFQNMLWLVDADVYLADPSVAELIALGRTISEDVALQAAMPVKPARVVVPPPPMIPARPVAPPQPPSPPPGAPAGRPQSPLLRSTHATVTRVRGIWRVEYRLARGDQRNIHGFHSRLRELQPISGLKLESTYIFIDLDYRCLRVEFQIEKDARGFFEADPLDIRPSLAATK